MAKLRIAVLASGRGSNMVSLIEKCRDGLVDGQVTLVVTDKPGAPCIEMARDLGVAATLELAKEKGESPEDYDARLLEALQAEDPDILVLAGYMRILTPAFCEAFAHRIINIHPSLLPAFKGAHGIRDALDGGVKVAGCTTHFVTADLDGGPIILQAAVAVHAHEGPNSLAGRVLKLEHQLLPRTVQLIAEGRIRIRDGIVHVDEGDSWLGKTEAQPGALYPDAY